MSINADVIPLTLHLSSVMFLNSSTAFVVSSDEIASLNVTSINVVLSLYILSFTSCGKLSTGILVPVASTILTTFSTPCIFLTSVSSFAISFDFIFSKTTIENAPISKSSERIFSP